MPETRSRMSLAAESISRPMENCIVTLDSPSTDDDSINSMPSIPEMRSSIISVMRVSTIFAGAPGYSTSTVTIGGSISGYSRRDKRSYETKPKATNNSEMTLANTGRFIETSDSIIWQKPHLPAQPTNQLSSCQYHQRLLH